MLAVTPRQEVLYVRCARAAAPGEASARLASEVINVCRDVRYAHPLPKAVVFGGGPPWFFLSPPATGADCDTLAPVWRSVTTTIGELEPPTIAAIQGDAVGPAWELALACDFRIASQSVRVGNPEICFGRMPAAGATQLLPRLAGLGTALRLLLFGEVLSAVTAANLGLLQRASEPDRFEADVEELLDRLRAAAPLSLAYTKEAVRAGGDLSLDSGMRLEADLAALLQTGSDRAEGIRSFLERRPPRYTGG